jgi:hypothetical protein
VQPKFRQRFSRCESEIGNDEIALHWRRILRRRGSRR